MNSGGRVIVLRARSHAIEWFSVHATIFASLALIFIFSVPVAMRVVAYPYTSNTVDEVSTADVVLIPGASVIRGGLSPILKARVELALTLFREGKVKRILISGDAEPDYDEVTPIKNYLLDEGVPENVIFLDPFGLDTYSSMYRARWVFGAKRIIIVSQDFHVPRSIFIARSLGLEAFGAVSPGGKVGAYAREVPASWKALFDLLRHRQPKYVGAPMPIAGFWRSEMLAAR